MRTLFSLSLIPFATAGLLAAQKPATSPAPLKSAPIANVAYEVTFNRDLAKRRAMSVTMTFDVSGAQPVLLSLPAWTPGAYEITDFAKWVSNFTPTRGGQALEWDKLDYDTWRIRTGGPGPVKVSFDFRADTLDNAMSWARDEFLLFNGTNVFMYPEGLPGHGAHQHRERLDCGDRHDVRWHRGQLSRGELPRPGGHAVLRGPVRL
jgi:hypothetical protein